MKIYVRGYRTKPDGEIDPLRPWENIDVAFDNAPAWSMDYRELAEIELASLNTMQVHVHEHYCSLAIEELPEGKFAIFCQNHPERQLVPTP